MLNKHVTCSFLICLALGVWGLIVIGGGMSLGATCFEAELCWLNRYNLYLTLFINEYDTYMGHSKWNQQI